MPIAPRNITVIKGAARKELPLFPNANAALGDIYTSRSGTTVEEGTHLTSGFYRIVVGPPRPLDYEYEECKMILTGEITVLVGKPPLAR